MVDGSDGDSEQIVIIAPKACSPTAVIQSMLSYSCHISKACSPTAVIYPKHALLQLSFTDLNEIISKRTALNSANHTHKPQNLTPSASVYCAAFFVPNACPPLLLRDTPLMLAVH